MIRSDDELTVVREQLTRAERALEAIRREVLPVNEERFRLMSEGYVEQILELRAQVDEYLGIDEAIEYQSSVAIGLEGADVRFGETSVGVMTRVLDAFRRGLQSLLDVTGRSGAPRRARGRRHKWVERLCDPPLLGVAPGSIRIFLGEPDTRNLFTEDDRELYRENLKLFFAALAWATEEDAQLLEAYDFDEDKRYDVLSVIRTLVPPRSIESLSFQGHTIGYSQPLRLGLSAKERIAGELYRLAESREYAEMAGRIREVDLDSRTFVLRERENGLPELSCGYDEAIEHAVKLFLDEKVYVTGVLRTSRKTNKGTLEVESIEPQGLEEEEEEEAADGSIDDSEESANA